MLNEPFGTQTARTEYAPPTYTLVSDASALVGGPEWTMAMLFVFRFAVVYFTFYVVTTQMLGALVFIPSWGFRPLASHGPLQSVIAWIASQVFGAKDFVRALTGSGDKTVDYVHVVLGLMVAAIGTGAWSVLAPQRRDERRAASRLRIFLRFALGATMISYGFLKAVPLQMPAPTLFRLTEMYGDFSPMGVLWASMGSSPSYEIFTGTVEVVSGALLFFPLTWRLGALLSLAATAQVFVLNMAYDVPVKLLSFHLLLMSLVLVSPDLQRLLKMLVLNRATEPSRETPLFSSLGRDRTMRIAQVVLGIYLITVYLWGSIRSWNRSFGGPKPPLYGLYDVSAMSTNGQALPPLSIDTTRWRRVIVERGPSFAWQTLDDTTERWSAKIDTGQRTIELSRGDSLKRQLHYESLGDGRLRVSGEIGDRMVDAELTPVDLQKRFLLLSRGFHWIQERPFNR